MRVKKKRLGISLLIGCLAVLVSVALWADTQKVGYPNLAKTKEIVIKRGFSPEAIKCIECHAQKTPGIIESWKSSRMAQAVYLVMTAM